MFTLFKIKKLVAVLIISGFPTIHETGCFLKLHILLSHILAKLTVVFLSLKQGYIYQMQKPFFQRIVVQ